MATTTLATAELQDHGLVEVRSVELDGITVDEVTFKQPVDMAFMLSSLPDGRCQCPHWGVVRKGRFVVDYGDRQETVNAGDAFHMTPGHVPTYDVGTEIVQFSPTEELKATDEAIQRGLAQLSAPS
jgi:hypothetical protein